MIKTTMISLVLIVFCSCRTNAQQIDLIDESTQSARPWHLQFVVDTGVLSEGVPKNVLKELLATIGEPKDRRFAYVSVGTTLATPKTLAYCKLERQQFSRKTNDWDKSIILPRLPVGVDFRDQKPPSTARDLQIFRATIELNHERIATPDFPALANDGIWIPPVLDGVREERKGEFAIERDASVVYTRINALSARADGMQRTMIHLAREYDRIDRAQIDPSGIVDRDDTALLRALAAWAYAGTKSDERIRKRNEVQRRAADEISDRYKKLKVKLEETEKDLEIALTDFKKFPQHIQKKIYGETESGRSKLKLWSHDVTCQPGETYRYRLVPVVLNPKFRINEKEPDAGTDVPLFVDLPASAWTSSIRIPSSNDINAE